MKSPRNRVRLFLTATLGLLLASSITIEAAKKPNARKAGNKSKVAKVGSAKLVTAIPVAKTRAASKRIDRLIKAGYKKHGVKPNPRTSDKLFVRRIYLDVVGRIPTLDEAKSFLDSTDKNKRSTLIDRLLDSEGHVSHQFNYWCDLLRIKSRMRYAPSKPYLEFVKQSLRDNKPFDEFVRELITAEGYTWDNGAAGYYLRDTGMPLDNMSNTAQVFLGTQLVCAQCHNHPYDSWTQQQYYQLAAFTYGIQTRDRRNPKYMKLREMQRSGKIDRETMRATSRIIQQLAYRVNETDRPLQLPKDYQYKDAKPRATIDPATIFGKEVKVEPGDSPADIYARWMTSAENPRFSHVIANRLWKRVMGIGLIEPVDDFKDGVNASNPKLMTFLVDQFVAQNFDMKQYLRMLFNTETYQREVTVEEVAADETYYFPGPILRRLSAEQLWDSLLAMTLPELDARKGIVRSYNRYSNGKELVKKDMKELIAMGKKEAKVRQTQYKFFEKTRDLQKNLRVAYRTKDRDKINGLRKEMADIRKEIYGPQAEMMMQRQREQASAARRETDPRWIGFSRDLVRASEVESPARPGHFLRQFGQSDRETIENANTEATVPQILTLLNGPMFNQLLNRNSVFAKNLANADSRDEKLDVIFLTILSRRPTEREKKITIDVVETDGPRAAADVVWALLNTRQFMFVQ